MRFSKKGIAVLRLPSRRNTLRPIERPLAWLAGLALALCAGTAAGAAGGPSSVAFWYAERPPLAELSQFDWVVLEAAHLKPADVGYLKEQGSTPFAYLSVGEFDGDAAAIADSGLARGKSAVRNQAWNSQVMDLAAPSWRAHLLKRAAELRKQGYAGLFLDTLDSFQLQAEERREGQRRALASFLAQLHRQEPGLKLFFNRGFEVLPELPGVASAVAVESIHAGWDAAAGQYREVPQDDRDWLKGHLDALRAQGMPIVAIDYLPPERRDEARALAARLRSEGYVPFVSTPALDYLGVSDVEVQPRRIALLYDPREGDLTLSPGHVYLGGLLEYLGYRVDYLPTDQPLPERPLSGIYAGVVTWMTSGPPLASDAFDNWIAARLDEKVPVAFLAGLPTENDGLLQRLGIRRLSQKLKVKPSTETHDQALLGAFEAPLVIRVRDLPALTVLDPARVAPALKLKGDGKEYVPVATADWGGFALAPYVLEEGSEHRRWILDPFAFLRKALRLVPLPSPDATTENGRRIATVHIDGDGFVSRAEVPGSPYAGQQVLEDFIKPYPFLTSVSVIEGEVGPKGMYPHLARELEPIARRIFADDKVEVASHTFSHPFFWQPQLAEQGENFEAQYGYKMAIPGYDKVDFVREVIGARDYIEQRLTTLRKPVKMIFWSGDALPDAATIKLAYDVGLMNVNGGNTALTRAFPSLTGLYPLIRPTRGGVQYYAPIINENVYTNLWQGPYYGFRGVIDTFALTDSPRRLRGLHLYYHFYSGTKQASIRTMHQIYAAMQAEHPLSLWMSDYIPRLEGLHRASLAKRADGSWQLRGFAALRTVRLDPALGWPDLGRSTGVAGVRDLPQGRYVHLSAANARLVLRDSRDPRPALEEANLPLKHWRYRDDGRVEFAFAGHLPLRLVVRAAGDCRLSAAGKAFPGKAGNGLWTFELPMEQVRDGQLVCR
ncbi:bifunctional glycoside hydrolase 114/ polysaccharide deacetylase family protein [Pseudomonas aeruginosa]|uniref:bifunctional glycoside hydrolase 114/ polysaccharide deacetylase family protein n=1 Tax=Pseudomonas aeruginosa TaxID=287 RepID=UPI0010675CEB|nr:bifunctional glycoside hydrolase 114/ polysaccharide deacetylase family protein [Pseudomonas aeruginosa]TER27690.1 PbsX family transcriptional regulator [Pseudomonas aeruginosa]TER48155.1 PbsX family transcriptional regulator [Pseudomonas aeruginosa]